MKLGAIVCYTATGSTVLRVTRERPGIPVIGLTPIESTARRLSLVWGVQTILTGDPENLSHMVRKACRIAYEEGLVKAARRHPHHRRRALGLTRRHQHDPNRLHRRERRADFGRRVRRAALPIRSGPARNLPAIYDDLQFAARRRAPHHISQQILKRPVGCSSLVRAPAFWACERAPWNERERAPWRSSR